MASFKDDEEHSSGSSINAVVVNAAKFFGKENFEGYDTPSDFLSYGKQLKPSDEEHLRKCINFLKQGLKTDGGSDIRKDVAGLQYQYFHFFKPRSRPGTKVVLSSAIVRLLSDYQNGSINVDFTLDDLINEAKKG